MAGDVITAPVSVAAVSLAMAAPLAMAASLAMGAPTPLAAAVTPPPFASPASDVASAASACAEGPGSLSFGTVRFLATAATSV
jgi:hypothetical protein